MSESARPSPLLRLAAEIVTAHASHTALTPEALVQLIESVHAALAGADRPAPTKAKPEPAVPVKRSVFPDYIVCSIARASNATTDTWPIFRPNALSVPQISFSNATRPVSSALRLVSSRRSSWLSGPRRGNATTAIRLADRRSRPHEPRRRCIASAPAYPLAPARRGRCAARCGGMEADVVCAFAPRRPASIPCHDPGVRPFASGGSALIPRSAWTYHRGQHQSMELAAGR